MPHVVDGSTTHCDQFRGFPVTLPILDTLQKMTKSLLVNLDIPWYSHTKRLFWISFYPSMINLDMSIIFPWSSHVCWLTAPYNGCRSHPTLLGGFIPRILGYISRILHNWDKNQGLIHLPGLVNVYRLRHWSHGPVEIVDLPSSMVIFPSVFGMFTRGYRVN